MTAFINVFAWPLFLGITGWFGLLFVAFVWFGLLFVALVQLTPYERARVKVTINRLISRLFA